MATNIIMSSPLCFAAGRSFRNTMSFHHKPVHSCFDNLAYKITLEYKRILSSFALVVAYRMQSQHCDEGHLEPPPACIRIHKLQAITEMIHSKLEDAGLPEPAKDKVVCS